LSYDSNLRLASFTDATGRSVVFGYACSDLKIRTITDPFGRIASFAYDIQARLQSITDPLGIVSSFGYDPDEPERIVSLTTPYGSHQFAYEGTAVSTLDNWALSMTDPQGYTSRIEHLYHDASRLSRSAPRPNRDRLPASAWEGYRFLFSQQQCRTITPTSRMEWNRKQWYQYLVAKEIDPTVDPRTFRSIHAVADGSPAGSVLGCHWPRASRVNPPSGTITPGPIAAPGIGLLPCPSKW